MKRILLIIISLGIFSCSSPSTIENYYLGNNKTMFFIVPVEFEGNGYDALIDYNIKASPDEKIPVICNFTIKKLAEIQDAYFITGADTIRLDSLNLLFKEFNNDEIRYTSLIKSDDIKKLFADYNPKFFIVVNNIAVEFKATSDHRGRVEYFLKNILPELKN